MDIGLLVVVVVLLHTGMALPVMDEGVRAIFGQERHCNHKFAVIDDLPHHVYLEEEEDSHNRISKRSLDQQLRIKVFYHDSVENLSKTDRDIIKEKVVPDAVTYWGAILKVRRNLARIRINRKCEDNQYFLSPGDPIQYCKNRCVETKCGEFVVPDDHLDACNTCNENGRDCKMVDKAGGGIDGVDFVLYVSALQTKQCGEAIGQEASTVAYAAHCQQEAAFDRPVAGHTNICPSAIKPSKEEVASMTSTVQHELLHALGFSSSLFAFYRNKDGDPLTERGEDGKPPINHQLQIRQWSDKVIKTVTRPWLVRSGTMDRKFNLMVTPRVVEEVRRHFNCSSLEGAELEDQGGDGTALTHWEKRLFQNEAMTGTVHTQDPVYSRLTFALMEDSGWYLPNYDMAGELEWGKNLGCDFALLSCKELMEKSAGSGGQTSYPFCSDLMQTTPKTACTADKRSVGSCNLVVFQEEVPSQYQNLDHVEGVEEKDMAKVGSSVTLADFCPYVQEFTWRSSGSGGGGDARGTRCTSPENAPSQDNNYALESYADRARCFEQGSKWDQRSCSTLKQWKRFGAGCYEYNCEDGMLNIIVRNVSITCEKEGQKIDVRLSKGAWLHEGSLVCPKCSDYCNKCDDSGKKARIDPATLQEDLEDSCFKQQQQNGGGGGNSLHDFLKGFGLDLGRRRK